MWCGELMWDFGSIGDGFSLTIQAYYRVLKYHEGNSHRLTIIEPTYDNVCHEEL